MRRLRPAGIRLRTDGLVALALALASGCMGQRAFPELEGVPIQIKALRSDSDYFQARFSISRFLTFRPMRYVLYQRDTPGLSEAGREAILAHELAHIAYYRARRRVQLISLAALVSERKQAKFEKAADMEAIRRGYGAGLAEYRNWLYRHVPAPAAAKKRRVYLTPEEILLADHNLRD